MTNRGSDTDEKLFFELSESNGSNCDASVFEQTHSSGETFPGPAPAAAVENGGHLEQQQQSVPDLDRERPSTEHGPADPQRIFEPFTHEPGKTSTAVTTSRNHRQATTQSAANGSAGDPPGSSPSDEGAALPSFNDAYHARNESSPSEAAEENAQAQPQSLDLVAAMLPLIPSFPEGSAEVRVRVHGVRIPCVPGHTLTTPPYVRASLHPGAHSIARTGFPSVGRGSTSRTSSVSSNRERGIYLVEHSSPAERVVEYVFGGEDRGANGDEHTISLSLGRRVVERALGENAEPSPPRIRLEIVSGRSLGRCDLALPEVLRRPGSMVRKLRLPV